MESKFQQCAIVAILLMKKCSECHPSRLGSRATSYRHIGNLQYLIIPWNRIFNSQMWRLPSLSQLALMRSACIEGARLYLISKKCLVGASVEACTSSIGNTSSNIRFGFSYRRPFYTISIASRPSLSGFFVCSLPTTLHYQDGETVFGPRLSARFPGRYRSLPGIRSSLVLALTLPVSPRSEPQPVCPICRAY